MKEWAGLYINKKGKEIVVIVRAKNKKQATTKIQKLPSFKELINVRRWE